MRYDLTLEYFCFKKLLIGCFAFFFNDKCSYLCFKHSSSEKSVDFYEINGVFSFLEHSASPEFGQIR